MTTQRVDLYTLIHEVARRRLFDLSVRAGRTDLADARHVTVDDYRCTPGPHDRPCPEARPDHTISYIRDQVNAPAVHADGKLVVAGYPADGAIRDIALARYMP